MRFLAAILTAFAVLFGYSTNSFAKDLKHRGYLVKLRPTSQAAGLRLLNDLGIKIESRIPKLNIVRTNVDPLKLELSAADRMNLKSTIQYVEPNYIAHRQDIQEEGELRDLNSLKVINAPAAWEVTKGSHDVIISVSDSGVWEHPDLIQNFWLNPGENGPDKNGKEKSKNKIDDDGNGYVDDYRGWDFGSETKETTDSMYHGTHVAGSIGAVGGNRLGIVGVAWNVAIMTAKFLDREGSGTYEAGINTIVYSADNGAKAVNCSWGGEGYSEALKEGIEYAKSKGTLVIAAAGNDNRDADKKPLYPAAYDSDNIISVASIYNQKGDLSWFSNWGVKSVDIAAVGENVYSTFNPTYSVVHRVFYEHLDGTSMATPHVAGAVALMYSVNPNLKWNEAKEIILRTGLKAPKLKGKVLTESVLDVAAAVREAQMLGFN